MRHLVPPVLILMACSPDSEPDPEPVPDVDLTDAAFTLDVSGLTVADADPGLGTLVRLFFTRTPLIGFHDVSDDELTIRMGFTARGVEPVEQDPCTITLELPPASRDGLAIELGPVDVVFQGAAVDYEIVDLTMSGVVSDDGQRLTQLTLSGEVDLRQVEALEFGTAENLCGSMADLELPCVPCDDGEATCARMQIEGITGSRVDVEVEAIEVLDPSCDAG